jgi:hypothetical protein
MSDISVVINGFRRPHSLNEQYEAIMNQTITPSEVLFWQNYHEDGKKFDINTISKCKSFIGNYNFGVWSRFAFALNCKSKYICIFDDDTIPGKKWFENCLDTMKTHRGLLGDRGVIFDNSGNYGNQINTYSGREAKNDTPVQVDIVGHVWFFEREWLSAYWSELPPPEIILAGEDMHFSYMLQKKLGLNTYVPPHTEDIEMWGSVKGGILGGDDCATSASIECQSQMQTYFSQILSKGFKLINK